MREVWTGGGIGWVANERVFDAVLAPFTDAIVQRAAINRGDRVLDVGCGFGTLLDETAKRHATPVGIDISEPMVDAARLRVPEATVLLADAQTADLTAAGPFDRVVSRFGVMFFEDPVAAFANIRSVCAPGATMTFICWRDGDNPMFTLGNTVLEAHFDPPLPPTDPSGPGSRSLGDPQKIDTVLTAAGWSGVAVEKFDGLCDYGVFGTDGVEERLAIILASSTGRRATSELAPKLGEQAWAQLLDEVRNELRRNLVDGVVRFPGHTWLVTATKSALT
jgi:SAM-dependent methyltransferase